jgi:hypothetical protein
MIRIPFCFLRYLLFLIWAHGFGEQPAVSRGYPANKFKQKKAKVAKLMIQTTPLLPPVSSPFSAFWRFSV